MTKFRTWAVSAGAMLLAAVPFAAEAQITVGGDNVARLDVGAGAYDIDQDKRTGVGRLEYEFGAEFFYLRPLIGTEVNVEGSNFTYGGFSTDIFFDDHLVLTPNAAVGFYARGNRDSKNLGSYIEFRTGAEFDYRFDDQTRLGLSFHHISNAGLTKRNPGEEELLVNYSIPLDGLP